MVTFWSALVEQLRLELFFQLFLAVILGGAVGLERELKGKPAGLRTTMLITIGATLFTVLSYRMGEGVGDPGRIAAQVLTGVGFIGAGTILHMRGAVTGLTSAASEMCVWLPTPEWPTLMAFGFALASATKSLSVRHGASVRTATTTDSDSTRATASNAW